MTQQEFETSLRAILNEYLIPFYSIIGAALAVLVIGAAIILIISPFIRRI